MLRIPSEPWSSSRRVAPLGWILGVAIGVLASSGRVEAIPAIAFIRGDVDQDGSILINDPILSLVGIFTPGASIPCVAAADANDDGLWNVADPVYQLSYLFIAGAPPPPLPFPDCGVDPTFDALDCQEIACQPSFSWPAFVLNAPTATGSGVDSILEIDLGSGIEAVGTLFTASTGETLRFLEYDFDVWVVRSTATAQEILRIDSLDGSIIDTYGGVTGEIVGMVIDDFSRLTVATIDSTASTTEVVRLDPFSSWASVVLWEAPEVYTVIDLAADFSGNVYLSGSNTTQSGVFRIDGGGVGSLWLPNPFPGTVHSVPFGLLYHATTPAGGILGYEGYDEFGVPVDFGSVEGYTDAPGEMGALFQPVIPVPAVNEVLLLDFGFPVGSLTAADGLDHPIDVATTPYIAVP
ncbi:MAG: hypothetical protein KDC38_17065 [Planctomycetes bacterium]|nr:hypothetical protein [Planctomycetota bacterium]